MKVERVLPTDEAAELLELVTQVAKDALAPRAAAAERDAQFPRDAFSTLGGMGLLGLPYPEEYGGSAQPYEVYLQVVEELSRAWLTVGLGVSVHTLSCFALARFGTDEQRAQWLPDMLGGTQLGAYCLSEPSPARTPERCVPEPIEQGTATGSRAPSRGSRTRVRPTSTR